MKAALEGNFRASPMRQDKEDYEDQSHLSQLA